jgi:L-seryl-tRNA(Ser) seleniumtransferase
LQHPSHGYHFLSESRFVVRALISSHLPRQERCIPVPRGIVRDVDTRRRVPRTDLLLADPRLADAERRLGRALVKAAVSRAQQRARDGQISPEEVADAAVAELPARAAALTPVINATGVLVHTNLGRAPLSAAAVDAIVAAAGHCDVEFDLASGMRSRRGAGRSTPWPGPSLPPRRWPWSTTTQPPCCSRPPR